MARSKRAGSHAPETKYHWKADETLSEGMRRIVSEQLQSAIWDLSENPKSLEEAVHAARKSIKKTRSALRLLGFDQENAALRDAGRKLSPLRDAQALIDVFDELIEKHRDKPGQPNLAPVREGLVVRKNELVRAFQRQRTRSIVAKTLRDVANRVKKRRLPDRDLPALSRGFGITMRRNRKAFAKAYDDSRPERFHEWRKRAKDLRYHLGLVAKAWPPVFEGYEAAAEELESKLGDDHNLSVLRSTILESPAIFGTEEEVKAFLEIVERHQHGLRSVAKSLAERLYGDKPRQWRLRLIRAWRAWKREAG